MEEKTVFICLTKNPGGTFRMEAKQDAPDPSADEVWAVTGPTHIVDATGIPASRNSISKEAFVEWRKKLGPNLRFRLVPTTTENMDMQDPG